MFRTIQGLRYHLKTYHMRSRRKREDSVGVGGCEVTVMGAGCEDRVDSSALRKQFKKTGKVACPQEVPTYVTTHPHTRNHANAHAILSSLKRYLHVSPHTLTQEIMHVTTHPHSRGTFMCHHSPSSKMYLHMSHTPSHERYLYTEKNVELVLSTIPEVIKWPPSSH